MLIVLCSCSVVGPGQRGVKISLGKVSSEVMEPGAYLWFPGFLGNSKIDIQIQKTNVDTSAASKDMQEIRTELAVNWSIAPEKVVEMYKSIGDEEAIYERVISPAVSEVMKAAVSRKTAEEVLIKRLELKKDIDTGLRERLANYGVTLHDVSIINLTFSKEFTHAIEEKQIAEQKAKEAEYDALRATKEADSEVNRAKGQAQAQNLLKQTLTPELLKLKAIEKWDGKLSVINSGNGGLILDVKDLVKANDSEENERN